ncbi:MAG: hypothetical protein EA406_11070 [Rhodospirillales bacterium]|nr:MAG: hypothetical protein EA406_11070 [Rhodospirillales bacterium]
MNLPKDQPIETSDEAAPSVLASHALCIAKVREHVYGAGRLQPELVAQDDACDLGRWLRGEAAVLRHRPEYWRAVVAHANFHKCAAEVVRLANEGRRTEAESVLAAGGPLRMASKALVESVSDLKRALDNKEAADPEMSALDLLQLPVRLILGWRGGSLSTPAQAGRGRT